MDNVCGIIAEYNPLHNGHIYHIRETRRIGRADFVIALISGNFNQRGLPTIFDKWTRAKLAIQSGEVDLVLEIPYFIATSGAKYYAKGSIGILEAVGVADTVSFGSEIGEMRNLTEVSDFLKSDDDKYKCSIDNYIASGMNFTVARETAVSEVLGKEYGDILKHANNVLAVEYLKNTRKLKSITVKREGVHNDDNFIAEFPSASAIRKRILEKNFDKLSKYVTEEVFSQIIKEYGGGEGDFSNFNIDVMSGKNISLPIMLNYYNLLRLSILRYGQEGLKTIFGVNEGIENRIIKKVRLHDNYEDFAGSVKSKRYTRTEIDRMMNHIIMGLKKSDVKEAFDKELWYTRPLAFNERGARLLKEAKEKSKIPIINNINREKMHSDLLYYDIMASDIYNLIRGRDMYKNSEFVVKQYIKC